MATGNEAKEGEKEAQPIPIDEIRLIEENKKLQKAGLSEVQATIVQQLRALNPLFMGEYAIKQILHEGANKIRLHMRGPKVVNTDITYNEGSDLYDVKAYRIEKNQNVDEIYCKTDIGWESLDDVLKAIAKRALDPTPGKNLSTKP